MRYQAPQHTSGVFAPSREYRADEQGVIELPDDAPDCDHAAMRAAGCVALAQDPVVAPSAPENGAGGDVSAKGKAAK